MIRILASGLIILLVIAGPIEFNAYADSQPLLDRVLEGEWNHPIWLPFGGGHGWSKPTFGDIDGDGDQDMLVGETEGNVVFYRNNGLPNYPQWTQEIRNIAQGEREAIPALVDIDGDGDLDLFIGSAYGRIRFYRNNGSPHRYQFQLEERAYISLDAGQSVAPTFVDYDRDGDMDLVISLGDGRIILYRNNGTINSPSWEEPLLILEILTGGMQYPVFADIDGDGDSDLLLGSQSGCISFYKNLGDTSEARLIVDTSLHQTICAEAGAAPAVTDIDGDGDPDLFIGTDPGNIFFLRNSGDSQNPRWELVTRHYLSVDFGNYSNPTLGDIDGDGDNDILLGLESGLVTIIYNQGNYRNPKWNRGITNYLSIQPIQNAAPCLVDLDRDGDLDALVGGADGKVQFFENTGRSDQPVFSLISREYGGIDVGANAVPTAADLDGDGDVDILVGGSGGNINYYRNDGPAVSPVWTLVTRQFNNINVGENASPFIEDLSGDGIPDLMVGNQSGSLAYYEGRSSAGLPYTFLTQAGNLLVSSIGRRIAPAAGDLDGDRDNDLIVGTSKGGIVFYRNAKERIPLTPSEVTLITGGQLDFQAQSSGGAVSWSLAASPSGGAIGTRLGNYRAGSVSGVTDIVKAVDSAGNIGYASVHVVSPSARESAGKAVIISGYSSDPRLSSATSRLGDMAYRSLIHLGYDSDKIVYLNSSQAQDSEDNGNVSGASGRGSFDDLVRPLASGQSSETLLVCLIGNGTAQEFYLNDTENLSFTEIDQWLDEMQRESNRLVIVVYDAPSSGSAVSMLQPPEGKQRIIITSCSEGSGAYFAGDGRISFSQNFWNRIKQGNTLSEAVSWARKSLSFIGVQNPGIDDNGNGQVNDPGDGVLAAQTRLGASSISGGDLPLIGRPFGAVELSDDVSTTLQISEVSDTDGIERCWAVIRQTVNQRLRFQTEAQPIVALPLIEMSYDPRFRIYSALYDQFLTSGQYEVLLYAEDSKMNLSLPMVSHVFQTVAGVIFLLQTDRTQYTESDRGLLSVRLAGSANVDVYLALIYPDNTVHYLILGDGCLEWADPDLAAPLAINWEIIPYSGPLFSFDLESMAGGQYTWTGILTQPGGDVNDQGTWVNSSRIDFRLE